MGYVVERKTFDENEYPEDVKWLKCNYTTITENCFTVPSLTEGEVYEFRVIARNGAGVHSAPSETTGPVTCRDEFCKDLLHSMDYLLLLILIYC